MKIKISLLVPITLLLLCSKLYAQVGIGTNTPATSAALEVASSTNNKGILIPRITATQKDAINNPAEGLMIYQTSAPAGFYYYAGSAWKLIMTQTDLDTKLSRVDATTSLNTKVDKVIGKELSSNDYTTVEKTKVSNLSGNNTGDQDLSALATTASVALKANTTDVSTNLALKVDKVIGKELSSNDYTTLEKTKLAAITGTNTGDQTNITGNAATATIATSATKLATVRTIGGVSFDGSADIDLPGVNATGNQNTSGNAGTATKLATAKNINGEAFDGSGDITVKADAGTLTGTTLNTMVTGSSLTTVGTLASATVSGKVIVGASSATSASAVLEASSTTQGFLPPRMTGAQRNQIASPAIGLMVYCTNCGSAGGEPQYYNGSTWVNMIGGVAALMPPPAIGDAYQGGIIAYILVSGDPGYDATTPHGLIAATSDQSTFIGWDIDMDHPTYQSGILIGTGSANTNAIFTLRGPSTDYAVGLVKAYRGGNYDDWYLPSLNELKKLLINKVEIGGFEPTNYWTSSEYESGPNSAYYVNFGNPGYEQIYGKTIGFRVRAVRSF